MVILRAMSNLVHLSARRLAALGALIAVLVALPVVAMPVPNGSQASMRTQMDCGGACPMMAAQRRSGHSGMGHAMGAMKAAPAKGSCRESMGFDCCAAAPAQPAVPLGEATPASTVTVPTPAATPMATLPAPTPRAALAASSAEGPEPPAAPLFLLHSSFLS